MSFEELEREVRHDLMRERWRKARPGIIVLVMLIVVSVTGYKGWQYYQSEQEITAANNYFHAQQLLGQNDPRGVIALQDIIADRSNLGYQTLAQFRLASAYIEDRKFAEARLVLLALSQQQGLRPYMQTIALLQAALLPAEAVENANTLKSLSPLLNSDNLWRHLARTIEIELLLREGSIAEARNRIDVMLNDTGTPPTLRETMSEIVAVL